MPSADAIIAFELLQTFLRLLISIFCPRFLYLSSLSCSVSSARCEWKSFPNKKISIMKFLEFSALDSINLFLDDLNLGESTIKGSLEAFSCKHAGMDRKLSLSLEHEILDYLGQSSESDPSSPLEYLSSKSSRKTLIYLVLTLGHMYPDYDFSAVRAHLFFREEEWSSFRQVLETYLFEAAKEWSIVNGGSLLESMTKAIDEVIRLEDCEVYSYNPDFDGNPYVEKGAICSFNFFFYNRKLKRVLSFRCCSFSNLGIEDRVEEMMDEETEDEDDLLIDMDM
ncbi:hypothetical protein HPP92_014955 [Vanilla planifolia]|uniref:Repressor of RNA polymerase III transcription n=1 Tax=Vanilla planifolia TaxID=51239 RepID=A0A835UTL7_VANPL|nr:hypothetical protein HPP92_014955 [Vanilla planifolia]